MKSTPARLLRQERADQPGQLLVERFGVHKIRKVDYLPHNTVTVQMTHQVTGAWATRNLRWDEQVTTEEPFEVRIGETGKIRVELALLADEEERPVYRWHLTDEAAGIDHEGADLYLVASHRADNTKAAETLLSFLSASAESWAAGHVLEADLFDETVNVWAANNSDEITIAAMELSGDWSDEPPQEDRRRRDPRSDSGLSRPRRGDQGRSPEELRTGGVGDGW